MRREITTRPIYARIVFGTALVMCTWKSIPFCSAAQQVSNSPPNRLGDDFILNSIFLRLINDNTIDADFFLDASGFVGKQQSDMKKLIATRKKELIRAYLRKNALAEPDAGGKLNDTPSKKDAEHPDEQIIRVQREFLNEVENLLAPHQIERMRQILWQRRYLALGIESYQLPLVVAKGLALTNGERKNLEERVKEESISFAEEKQRLKQEAWKKIKAELPKEVIDAMDEKLGLQIDDDALHGNFGSQEKQR